MIKFKKAKIEVTGLQFLRKCPDFTVARAFRCIFFQKDAVQSLLRPCQRPGLLSRTKPQAAQQNLACRIPAPLAGSDRSAALYLADPARPSCRHGLAFGPYASVGFVSINRHSKPFQFFNRKGKSPCAAVKGL